MGSLKKRFEGPDNRTRLIAAVVKQQLVAGNEDLAAALVDKGELEELAAGEILIQQGQFDDEMFFILAGSFQVTINGRNVVTRESGTHVGEQAGVDPSKPRSATVTAMEVSLVLRLKQADLEAVTANNTVFWRRLSAVFQERLEERNRKIGQTNDIPRVFVISSSEGKDVAEEVHKQLDGKTIAVQLWDQGTFGISDYPISSLMDAMEACDFTVSIVRADDVLISRGKKSKSPRDNVHLEVGMSLGMLSRPRTILLVCADDEVRLASDLAGLTTLRYSHGSEDEMRRSVRTACMAIKDQIKNEGVFQDRRDR